MNVRTAKIIAKLSRGIFLYFPRTYFLIYSWYKKLSDSFVHEILEKYIKPGMSVIDIGAHIGHYSVLMSGLVGGGGKVFAYEPDPINFERLEKNIKRFKNVHAYNFAVGAESCQIDFFVSADLDVDHRAYETKGEKREKIQVDQVALDDQLKRESGKIGFIKIDVEGYEYFAFSGMQKILLEDRPVVLSEVWPWGIVQAGAKPQDILDMFNNLGYKVRLIDEKTKTLREFSLDDLGMAEEEYYNILALP